MNQYSFKCRVCLAGEAVVAFVEKEVHLRHSYKRISEATGISRSSLHRHIHGCAIRRRALEQKSLRTPENFHLRVRMPSGEEFFHEGVNPFDRFRGVKSELPTLEIDCVFENPVAPRVPQEVLAATQSISDA